VNKRIKKWVNGRIIYYQDRADAAYWDRYWQASISEEFFNKYQQGSLDEYKSIFLKYFKKEDAILEAGCGTGKYVLAFRSRGFLRVEGIEWGRGTVQEVRKIYPDLPIYVGDATKIEKPDNYYDGYISLGVVEHLFSGPKPFIDEAFRVTKPGGYAIFTVPAINVLRMIKGHLGCYNGNADASDFYQYAFSKSEFTCFLQESGFQVVETGSFAGYFGLLEEFPQLFKFLDHIKGGWRIKRFLKNSTMINIFGHLSFFVCTKNKNSS